MCHSTDNAHVNQRHVNQCQCEQWPYLRHVVRYALAEVQGLWLDVAEIFLGPLSRSKGGSIAPTLYRLRQGHLLLTRSNRNKMPGRGGAINDASGTDGGSCQAGYLGLNRLSKAWRTNRSSLPNVVFRAERPNVVPSPI
jgi:hypothetical protein